MRVEASVNQLDAKKSPKSFVVSVDGLSDGPGEFMPGHSFIVKSAKMSRPAHGGFHLEVVFEGQPASSSVSRIADTSEK